MTHSSQNQTPEPGEGSRRSRRRRKKSSLYDYPGGRADRIIDVLEVGFLLTWLWRPLKWVGRGLWRMVDFQ